MNKQVLPLLIFAFVCAVYKLVEISRALAPGSWVRGSFPGFPGYSHLPWWSKGIGDVMGNNPGNFYYVGGTSMATPHVEGIAALILERDPDLTQPDVESILRDTALGIPAGSRSLFDINNWILEAWDVDATGAGLVQAYAALEAIP